MTVQMYKPEIYYDLCANVKYITKIAAAEYKSNRSLDHISAYYYNVNN